MKKHLESARRQAELPMATDVLFVEGPRAVQREEIKQAALHAADNLPHEHKRLSPLDTARIFDAHGDTGVSPETLSVLNAAGNLETLRPSARETAFPLTRKKMNRETEARRIAGEARAASIHADMTNGSGKQKTDAQHDRVFERAYSAAMKENAPKRKTEADRAKDKREKADAVKKKKADAAADTKAAKRRTLVDDAEAARKAVAEAEANVTKYKAQIEANKRITDGYKEDIADAKKAIAKEKKKQNAANAKLKKLA